MFRGTIDSKAHFLWLKNSETLFGVEIADLSTNFKRKKGKA